MLTELIQNIMAFWLRWLGLNKITKNSYAKWDIVKRYIDKYYQTSMLVPIWVLNPLYHIITKWKWTWISLYYTSKNMTKYWLVRNSRGKFFIITSPELLVPKDVILKMKPTYKYSALISHLIRTWAIKSILNFYSSEVSKII